MKSVYLLTAITASLFLCSCADTRIYNDAFTDYVKSNHLADSIAISESIDFNKYTNSTVIYNVDLIGGQAKDSTDKAKIKAKFIETVLAPARKENPYNSYKAKFIYDKQDADETETIRPEDMKNNSHL